MTILWLCVWRREFRWLARLRPKWGAPLLIALVAPWLIAIWIVSDGAFYAEAVGRDLIGKVQSGQESHGAPPGYFLGAFWGTFWPWAPLALFAAPLAWARRTDPNVLFLLGWIIPFWIILELVPTKLPHYVLPLYPAAAALVAGVVLGDCAEAIRRSKSRRWIATGLYAIPLVVLAFAALLGPLVIEGRLVLGAVLLGGVALGAGWLAIRAFAALRIEAAAAPALLSAAAVIVAAFQFVLPSLDTAFPSPRLAKAAAPFLECTDQPLGSADYHEPSLVFIAGTDTKLLRWSEAAAWMADADGRLVWMPDHRRETFDETARELGVEVRELAELSGFNYNRGKFRTWRLLIRADDPLLSSCPAIPG